MFRKVTLVLLVLFGFVLSGMAEVCFADVSAELEQAKALVKEYIASGKETEAADAYQKLITDFAGNPLLSSAVYDIAETYRHNAKFDKSLQVYQDIVTKWPSSSQAVWAQRGAAISNIALDKMAEAQAELDKLKTNYSADPNIAEAVFNVADTYYWFKHYEKANELYQHVLNTWPGAEHAMWAQMGLAISTIADGSDVAAQAATERLIADFNSNPKLPEALFYIAGRYEWSKKFKQAKSIYQQIAQQYPESPQAGEVPFALARMNVSSLVEAGDNSGALTAVDELIIDFSDRPDLPSAIFTIGEEYYNQALQYENQGRDTEAKEHSRKALTLWKKIITELPTSAVTADAYFMSAHCCLEYLGEYEKAIEYCQKVVSDWPDYKNAGRAQFLIGECYEQLRNSGGLPESEADPKIEQAYEAVVENYPDCASVKNALLKLGWLDFKRGQWAEAARCWELSLEKYPEDQRPSRILYPLGRAYEEIGRLDKAVQVYSEFIKTVYPGDPRMETVKARLEKLALSK